MITMNTLPEQVIDANRAAIETFLTMANAAFGGAERLAALNLNAARTLLDDSAANTRAMLAIEDVPGLVSLQGTLAQPGMDKAGVYSRSLYRIASETREALSEVVEGQVSELNTSARLVLDKAARQLAEVTQASLAAVAAVKLGSKAA